jgi:hypothetical protein
LQDALDPTIGEGQFSSNDPPVTKKKAKWRNQLTECCTFLSNDTSNGLDLALESGKGISLQPDMEDTIKLADKQTITYHSRLILIHRDETLQPRIVYIHRIPSNSTILPPLHISRDEEWTSGNRPRGHHTLNSLYGGFECIIWTEYVAKITSVVDIVLKYRVESSDVTNGRRRVRRLNSRRSGDIR